MPVLSTFFGITVRMYRELQDPTHFRSVGILPGGEGIEWPDGQDIAPHKLYELSTPML